MEKNNKAFQLKIKKSAKTSTESVNSNNSDDDPNLRYLPNVYKNLKKKFQ